MKNSSWGDGSGIEGTPDPWSENTSGWGQSAWGESTSMFLSLKHFKSPRKVTVLQIKAAVKLMSGKQHPRSANHQ